MFPATNFRLKRLKKSPIQFQHHKAIIQLDHNTSPKFSSTTTTTKAPPLHSEITPTQSTSTNTPSTITVATTTANTATTTTPHTVSTSYTITTANTTTTNNTSTQTDIPIPALMQLDIPISSRIRTPSTSITIPLSSSISPYPIYPRTLQDLQRLGLWQAPSTIRTTTKGGQHQLALLKTPRTQGTHEDAHSSHTKIFVFKNSNNKGNTHKKL